MKYKEIASICSQECIAPDVYSMWIKTENIAREATAGQFVSLYVKDASKLLPRPISICEICDDKIRVVYRVAGAGTKEISSYIQGNKIELLWEMDFLFEKKVRC